MNTALLELIEAAQALGYIVDAFTQSSITLVVSQGGHTTRITLEGSDLTPERLRELVREVERG